MIDLEVGGRRERIRPGLHICQFYNQTPEIVQTAGPFLKAGLHGSDKCYFAAPTARHEELRKQLKQAHIDVDAALASGQLVLVDTREELLPNGRFDPYQLLASHQGLIAKSLNEGWQHVRAAFDMGWLSQGMATPEQVLKYEAAADAVFTFQNRPIVALTQYNSADLPGELVVELLKLHPIAIVGKFIKRNPYYINAEEYIIRVIRRGQQRRGSRPPAA
jgi:hypothetical protein